jgi:hypothetical protein
MTTATDEYRLSDRLSRARRRARPGDPVTPELVLVATPEEAELARTGLPEEPWTLAYSPLPRKPAANGSQSAVLQPSSAPVRVREEPAPAPPAKRRRRPLRRALLLGLALLAGVAAVALAFRREDSAPKTSAPVQRTTASTASTPASTASTPASTTPSPSKTTSGKAASGSRPPRSAGRPLRAAAAPAAPTLHWKPRAGVSSYWVVLSRVSGRRSTVILTFVTNDPRLKVPRSWNNAGRRQRLAPGRYRWSAWAYRAGLSATPAKPPLARGSFAVPRR